MYISLKLFIKPLIYCYPRGKIQKPQKESSSICKKYKGRGSVVVWEQVSVTGKYSNERKYWDIAVSAKPNNCHNTTTTMLPMFSHHLECCSHFANQKVISMFRYLFWGWGGQGELFGINVSCHHPLLSSILPFQIYLAFFFIFTVELKTYFDSETGYSNCLYSNILYLL